MTASPDPQRLIAAHTLATDFYRDRLLSAPRALAYLRSRGIAASTAHNPPWTLGYAPRSWIALREHLRQHGFTDAELLAAGLVMKTSTGQLIDVFRERVMFPIRDPADQVVAFTGRNVSARPDVPKYRNTITTAIYQKSRLFYGLAEQLPTLTTPAAVMLVEGPADVVAVTGLRLLPATGDPQPYHPVAPCGTALTAQQLTVLSDTVPTGTPLVVAFDADQAGQAALDRIHHLLRQWPGPVDAMSLPDGKDPADVVAAGPTDALEYFSRARTPVVDHCPTRA